MKEIISCSLLAVATLLAGCNDTGPDGATEDVSGASADSSLLRCASMEGDACAPRTFSLLSDPDSFHGKKIIASGYATWGERSLVVYPSLDMACSQTGSSGIEIDHGIIIPSSLSSDLESHGVVSVSVKGMFKSDDNGLAGRYVGHLDEATIVSSQLPRSLLKVDPRTLRGAPSGAVADIAIQLPKPTCQ